jgi:hypothetical protein
VSMTLNSATPELSSYGVTIPHLIKLHLGVATRTRLYRTYRTDMAQHLVNVPDDVSAKTSTFRRPSTSFSDKRTGVPIDCVRPSAAEVSFTRVLEKLKLSMHLRNGESSMFKDVLTNTSLASNVSFPVGLASVDPASASVNPASVVVDPASVRDPASDFLDPTLLFVDPAMRPMTNPYFHI